MNTFIEAQIAAANPQLKDIIPVLELWAKKCVAAAGKNYSAFASLGKRAYDREKYHAIVIEKDGCQLGTIPLRTDEFGNITYNIQKPLCGEWDKDARLPMADCIELLRRAVESVVGGHLAVNSIPYRLLLQRTVQDKARQNLDWLTSVTVQTRRYNNRLPMSALNRDEYEKWKIDFEHHFFAPDKAQVKLVAQRVDVKDNERFDIASGTIDPQNPTGRVELKGQSDDFPEIFAALAANGRVEPAGDYTERHQDYPGAEIEQFYWKKVDVTDLYRKYIQLRNAQYLFSPLTDIKVVRRGDDYDLTPKNWLVAKQAGIYDIADKIKTAYEAEHLNHTAQSPLYNFILQDKAQQLFAKEVKNLSEAMHRITDVNYHFVTEGMLKGPHIRCKIDGEQQMSISIGHELMEKCNHAKDPELAWLQLAALFYNRELSETVERSQGMKR